MADKKKQRKITFVVCIILCIVCFAVYYFMKANLCTPASTNVCFEMDPRVAYLLTDFMAQLGNSGLVFTLLWYFGAPALKKMIKDRRDNLERDIRESARLKQEAETVCSDAEVKIEHLNSEVKNLTAKFQEAADEECKQIAANAKQTAERLRKDAETSFELQSNVSQSAFEKELMFEAIERAREEIKTKLASDSSLRNKLIDQSIASLEL